MCSKFKSDRKEAITNDVESDFKTIKHHVAPDRLMRVDKFIDKHSEYIRMSIKQAFAAENTTREEKRSTKTKTKQSNFILQFFRAFSL